MKFQTKNIEWTIDRQGAWIKLLHPDKQVVQDFISSLEEKPYEVKIEPFKKKRSLDANAYYWTLLGKLSAKLRVPNTEIYRQHILDIGDNYEILPIKDEAVEKFTQAWCKNGAGWIVDVIGKSKLDGYTNIMAYYGSSTYDSKQMSRLVDLAIEDCKAQGVETLAPAEIERLKGGWNG